MTQPSAAGEQGADPRAVPLLARLLDAGATVAVAESLTGGGVTMALTSVPGASAAVRGGVVAYATDLKAALLDVDAGLLAARGAVDPDVAAAMAHGVAVRCGADLGLATTGVAGPDPQDGRPPGTVYVAAHDRRTGLARVRSLAATGDRAAVRDAAVTAVLALAVELLDPRAAGGPTPSS